MVGVYKILKTDISVSGQCCDQFRSKLMANIPFNLQARSMNSLATCGGFRRKFKSLQVIVTLMMTSICRAIQWQGNSLFFM